MTIDQILGHPVLQSQAKQRFGYVVIFQDTTESVNLAVQMYILSDETKIIS